MALASLGSVPGLEGREFFID